MFFICFLLLIFFKVKVKSQTCLQYLVLLLFLLLILLLFYYYYYYFLLIHNPICLCYSTILCYNYFYY